MWPLSQPRLCPGEPVLAVYPSMTTLSLLAGGSPELGKWPHPERADSSVCGSIGPVCGTKILQIVTPRGSPGTLAWTSAKPSPLIPSPAAPPTQEYRSFSKWGTQALGRPLPRGQLGCRDAPTLRGANDLPLWGPSCQRGAVAFFLSSLGLPQLCLLGAGEIDNLGKQEAESHFPPNF